MPDTVADRSDAPRDRTLVVSGASRGIGLAIAVGAAAHGANVVLLAKTADSEVLVSAGVTDLSRYGGGDHPILDLFLDPVD